MQYKASAPGSLMLLGEYAVLYGKQAIVIALDKRITVTLTPRTDTKIKIHSTLLGHHETDLNQLEIQKPFHYVLGVIEQFRIKMKRGCTLDIESDFSDKMGLGSSAAVIVATMAALVTWLNIRISPLDLVRQGKRVIRDVQGLGSGADIAASIYGGIVAYQTQPLFAEKYQVSHPICALYAGYKTPTAEAIMQVQQAFATYPNLFRALIGSIGQCGSEGSHLLRKADWAKIGELMTIQQGMMESLGVSTLVLRDMIDDLRKQPGMLGAKISGSGLGDCVIGLGSLPEQYVYEGQHSGIRPIAIQMSMQGVHCEKI